MHRYSLPEARYARTTAIKGDWYFMMPSSRTLFRVDKEGDILDIDGLATLFGGGKALSELKLSREDATPAEPAA